RQLTSGIQGATHSPVFSPSGDKVAWLELAIDGHESDRRLCDISVCHSDFNSRMYFTRPYTYVYSARV
ncbi:hypothetical protein BDR07DRAFT_1439646, partial [Suillus spraguei]